MIRAWTFIKGFLLAIVVWFIATIGVGIVLRPIADLGGFYPKTKEETQMLNLVAGIGGVIVTVIYFRRRRARRRRKAELLTPR